MSDFRDQLPRTIHMYAVFFAHLNSSLNPILYAITNPCFRRGYKNFINFIFFKRFGSKSESMTMITTKDATNQIAD